MRRLFPLLIVFAACTRGMALPPTTTFQTQLAPSVMDPVYGAYGDGTTDDSTAIQNCSTVGACLIPSATFYINANITLPNALQFMPGASFLIASGKTVTINGAVIAPPMQIFQGAGTVTLGTTASNPYVYAEWWGAVAYSGATNSTNVDSALAFQKADAASPNGATIKAQAGHYRMNTTFTVNNTNLEGSGKWKTVFEPGAFIVSYSSMSMFSLNNHYAHYESFQVNSNVAISTFTVFLSSNAAGGENIRDIQMVDVGIGFNVPVNNGAHWGPVFINGCAKGLYAGGSSGLAAGDVYLNDFTIIPYINGYGLVFDKNSSAFYITNLTVLSGIGGVWETLGSALVGSDIKPSNILLHHPVINAQTNFGLRIDAGLYTTLDDNPVINGISGGSAVSVNPSTPSYVDGLEIDNALINGNFNYGVDFAGCNLSILGGNYLANGVAGVHVGPLSCGLIKLQNLMAGTTIWANAANAQSYGIQVENIQQTATQPITGNVFVGRLQVQNNMLVGNAVAGLVDTSTIPQFQKVITDNFVGSTPMQGHYGNFIGSSTVVGGSSVTVSVSGFNYTRYVVRLVFTNATGSNASVFVRMNQDAGNNYGYSLSGYDAGASTGAYCAHTSASAIALTSVGATNANNDLATSLYFRGTLDVDVQGVTILSGHSVYLAKTANDETGLVFGGGYNGTVTSIQAWVGSSTSCTAQTDPLTGTTGTMEVYGIY